MAHIRNNVAKAFVHHFFHVHYPHSSQFKLHTKGHVILKPAVYTENLLLAIPLCLVS